MSVEQINVIDAIGVETESGKVVLTISDHLDWTDGETHLQILQEKINTYLGFVESGELVESYPDAEGRTVVIDIVSKFPLIKTGEDFFLKVSEIMAVSGFELRIHILDEK